MEKRIPEMGRRLGGEVFGRDYGGIKGIQRGPISHGGPRRVESGKMKWERSGDWREAQLREEQGQGLFNRSARTGPSFPRPRQ